MQKYKILVLSSQLLFILGFWFMILTPSIFVDIFEILGMILVILAALILLSVLLLIHFKIKKLVERKNILDWLKDKRHIIEWVLLLGLILMVTSFIIDNFIEIENTSSDVTPLILIVLISMLLLGLILSLSCFIWFLSFKLYELLIKIIIKELDIIKIFKMLGFISVGLMLVEIGIGLHDPETLLEWLKMIFPETFINDFGSGLMRPWIILALFTFIGMAIILLFKNIYKIYSNRL